METDINIEVPVTTLNQVQPTTLPTSSSVSRSSNSGRSASTESDLTALESIGESLENITKPIVESAASSPILVGSLVILILLPIAAFVFRKRIKKLLPIH